MKETVSTSAHTYCSRMAVCGEGAGPCLVSLEAENARLQAQVEEARLVEVDREIATKRTIKLLRTERDRYKALAERRKEVLGEERERVAWLLDYLPNWQKRSAAYKTVKEGYARAAIEEEGEETGDKNPCRVAAEDWCTRPEGHSGWHRGNSGLGWLQKEPRP